jgi:hypothetical protein
MVTRYSIAHEAPEDLFEDGGGDLVMYDDYVEEIKTLEKIISEMQDAIRTLFVVYGG